MPTPRADSFHVISSATLQGSGAQAGTGGPAVGALANFTATPTSGSNPLSVTFTNQSSNYTGSSWDFGDGTTSTVANPTKVYSGPGSYDVRLTVTGARGSDSITKKSYINVNSGGTVWTAPSNENQSFAIPSGQVAVYDFDTSVDCTFSLANGYTLPQGVVFSIAGPRKARITIQNTAQPNNLQFRIEAVTI